MSYLREGATILNVRELTYAEIALVAEYWATLEDAQLLLLGVDKQKLPEKAQLKQILISQIDLPIENRRSFCLIWELGGKPIGHSNTNPTIFGNEAFMHLHIWSPQYRGKGYGEKFLKLSINYFFEKLRLQKLICEPHALNPAPHKAVEKAGFKLIREYITIPGSINFEQPVKRWELLLEDLQKQ
jgi:RimJ/RimL family protein N-acetyltransferase